MKRYKFLILLLLLGSQSAWACTVTLNPGTNVISAAVSSAATGATICLNSGSYTETAVISLKQGQTLDGNTSANTIITSVVSPYPLLMATSATARDFHLYGNSTATAQYGTLAYQADSSLLWNLKVEGYAEPILISESDDVNIWNLYTVNNGNQGDSHPDTDIHLWHTSGVTILYGSLVGRGDGPFGDGGSISCFGSDTLTIDGTSFQYSGNSAVYLVDCDDAQVSNTTIYKSGEWGLDVVGGETAGLDGPPSYLGGTEGFEAYNNSISDSWFGASVFDEAANGTGHYEDNYFHNNNESEYANCNGVNVIGSTANVGDVNNTTQSLMNTAAHSDQITKCVAP